MEFATSDVRARRRRKDLAAAVVLLVVAAVLAVARITFWICEVRSRWMPTITAGAGLAVLAGVILIARARSSR